MEKLKKATKRIVAVGAIGTYVAAAAFGAGLSNYPGMFVEDGSFNGKVVVGTGVGADDTTAANSVIEDLRAEFSGETEKVMITYKKVAEGGDSVSAVDDKETLNYGETLASVGAELDKDVSDLLEDGTLDDNDYTQELELLNGEFSYRIFDEVDDEETAKAGLYYEAAQSFLKYTMDFEDEPAISTSDEREDLVGEEMSIMGNEFTVVEIENDALTLIGGANKVSLGEGESTKVTVDGKAYDISIQSVSDTKVLLTVNGQSSSIDLYETDDLAGVSIAVTDLVSSSRDAVKGYAEIVVGGQKVELTSSGVKVNDEDLEDVYDDYEVDVVFSGSDAAVFEGLEITYKVDENIVLAKGDMLKDVLFDSFALSFDGLNDAEYSEFKITSDNDEVSFSGNLYNGNALPSEFKLTTDNVDGADLYLGSTSDRIYFQQSNTGITDLISAGNMDAIVFNSTDGPDFNISATTTDVKDNIVWTRVDDEEFYLYKIAGIDNDDLEIDFTDLIADKDTNAVDIDDVQSALEWASSSVASNTSGVLGLDLSLVGDSILYLENELEMDFSAVEVAGFAAAGASSDLVFNYNSDVEMDDADNESDSFAINITRASDADDAIELKIDETDSSFVNDDDVEEDSDYHVYVDHYGTMVTVDEDKFDDITIAVPDKEVEGLVSIVFGDAGATVLTKTVDAADVEDAKAELEEDGYTIVSTETLASEEVSFDVAGVTLDTDVADMEDLIVVGGPAVNAVARSLLGIDSYTIDQAGVAAGEGVVKYFADSNSVLVYGYSKEDTVAAVSRLNAGGLSGDEERVE